MVQGLILKQSRFTNVPDTGYPHDGRADKDFYPHDGRADKDFYPHDRHITNTLC